MPSELTVIVKNSDKTLRTKHLIYDVYEITPSNPIIDQCVQETKKNFNDEIDSVSIKISMEVV